MTFNGSSFASASQKAKLLGSVAVTVPVAMPICVHCLSVTGQTVVRSPTTRRIILRM
jgi:hypothetical protein